MVVIAATGHLGESALSVVVLATSVFNVRAALHHNAAYFALVLRDLRFMLCFTGHWPVCAHWVQQRDGNILRVRECGCLRAWKGLCQEH
jgi:hypothetical protein